MLRYVFLTRRNEPITPHCYAVANSLRQEGRLGPAPAVAVERGGKPSPSDIAVDKKRGGRDRAVAIEREIVVPSRATHQRNEQVLQLHRNAIDTARNLGKRTRVLHAYFLDM